MATTDERKQRAAMDRRSRTVDGARTAAYAQGWRSTRYPTQDWCPDCMERVRR